MEDENSVIYTPECCLAELKGWGSRVRCRGSPGVLAGLSVFQETTGAGMV